MADPGPVLCWGCSPHPARVNKTQLIHSKRIMQRGAICWYPTFLVAQIVKNLSIKQGSRVQPLGREDPLEKGMATHSSIFTWKIPWTEEPGGLQSMESQRVKHDRATLSHTHTHTHTHTVTFLSSLLVHRTKSQETLFSRLPHQADL